MELLYFILFVLFFCIIIGYNVWNNRYFEIRQIRDIKPRIPFLGNLLSVIIGKQSLVMCVHDMYKMFPEEAYFGLHELSKHCLVVRDINLIREIGVKAFESFHDHRMYVDDKLDSMFGNFLITLRGNKWKEMRSMLSPAFTKLKLKSTLLLILECGEQLQNYFMKITDKLEDNEIIEIEMNKVLKYYTNDIIASTAFGLKVNSFEQPNNDIYRMGKLASDLGGKKFLKFFMYSMIPNIMKALNITLYDENVKNFFRNLTRTVIDQREKSGKTRPDIIQLLMEARKEKGNNDKRIWFHDELTAQSMLFFIAGYDSTSNVLSFIFYELARHPTEQKRLQKEVDDFLFKEENFTLDSVSNLKYMDMIVSETLRLWPPVGMVDRVCTKPFTIPPPNEKSTQSYKTKVGEVLWIPIFSIQRDPENFSNPEKFDPERFSDENKSKIKPFSYMPFGVGPRRCIGYRYSIIILKVALLKIVSKFDLIGTNGTNKQIKLDGTTFVTQSKHGYWIGLRKRIYT